MRIPFPSHIPVWGAIGFATFLFAVQLWQGTAILFAICCFLFIFIATLTFNVAGGFTRPSGAYIFFYAVLAVILGLCWKAVLGEPADSNLLAPQLTIETFLGGITAMLGAAYISRKLTPTKALLQNTIPENRMQNATVGCMVTGILLGGLIAFTPKENGSILSAVAQVNRFLPMAIILGVIHEIRKSGGTRSVNLPVLLSGGALFYIGLLGFSKEGMFTPFVTWLVAAASQRYKLSKHQIWGGVLVALFMLMYLVPYAQYGRDSGEGSYELLTHLGDVRDKYNASASENFSEESGGYFNSPQGLFDRLQMISVDDGIIYVTEERGTFGLTPIIAGFENLVPRAFWPNKPSIGYGNVYAHEIGGLPEDDFTTGVSFSPSGEAYHLARWNGIFLVAPMLWIMLFTLFDSLCGDTRVSPWGLLLTAYFSHQAPEGMLGGIIYVLGFGTFGILVVAFAAAYVMPIVGTFFKGPEKTMVMRTPRIRSFPRRISPSIPSQDMAG